MRKLKPIALGKQNRLPLLIVAVIGLASVVVVGYYAYRYLSYPSSARWQSYQRYLKHPEEFEDVIIQAGQRCGDAPFAWPSSGLVFGLWDQSYRPGHRHSGLDIFAGTEPGETPIYAVYDGYLTRKEDWVSTVIIRHPEDPLHPGKQVWTYYTHMASKEGESFVSEAFPPGTSEVFVPAGTLLGYEGNFSGDPVTPTGLHLHISIVKDDGSGSYLNELEISNTWDPSPYFGLPLDHNFNPDEFPVCDGVVSQAGWGSK